MTREALFINADNNGYEPSQCGRTITVGELIDLLSDFDEDMPIYLKFDNLRNIEIPGQVTYSSEMFTFLFWEIERQTRPRCKITIRRRTADTPTEASDMTTSWKN